ncbi:MAG: hypothetical protein Q7R34_06400 [Dehalococcoidia bacterium]|nr:hypothetical protein [Dehalococcoidia bacterium]
MSFSPTCQWTDSKGLFTRTCGQPADRVLLGEVEEIHLCPLHRQLLVRAMVRQWKREVVSKVLVW